MLIHAVGLGFFEAFLWDWYNDSVVPNDDFPPATSA
jgi:hypothetical protein